MQLGEVVNISGNRLSELKNFNESLILKVYKEGKEIENNEFDFNIDLKRWEYDYRPPSSGKYNYEIFMRMIIVNCKKVNLKCWKVKLSYQMCL